MGAADARALLAATGGRACAAGDLATALRLLREGARPAAVFVSGARDAAPVLTLLEAARAAALRDRMLAAQARLTPVDVAILQDSGVETVAGATPERQARALRERMAAAPEAPQPRRGERRLEPSLDDLAAASATFARAAAQGRRALRAGLPVLVEGEAGVGKLAFARALHAAGLRRQRPLLQLGPDAAAEGLAAAAGRLGLDLETGLIHGEAGGSLYLRDIGDWPAPAQGELMELLRRRNALRGRDGALRELKIFASARQPLIQRVGAGAVRDDLYYLLSVAPVSLPPLRNLREDLPAIVAAVLARMGAGRAAALRPGFPGAPDAEAMAALAAADWPGNIAQLRARLCHAALRAGGGPITAADVAAAQAPDAAETGGWTLAWPEDGGSGAAAPAPPCAAMCERTAACDLPDIFDGQGELRPLAEIEAGVIRFAVRHYGGQMSEVSRRLGIGRSTLYRKLRDLDLLPEREAAGPARLRAGGGDVRALAVDMA
ncbi:sigma 54-interacting transcriptional regulator [Camelimonas abortus]